MTFLNGTITNANPGPALYAVIETAALAQGWTLSDTVTIGSNTHKVLKSAAAGNVQNLDWFLDINYPTTGTTGGIRFAAFEGYDPVTKLAVNGPYSANNTTIDPTTFSRYGATGYALETNWLNTSGHAGISNTLTTTAFTYWISITRDRIIVMLSTGTTNIHYAGFYVPTTAHATHAGVALFPLITTRLTITSSASNATSSANNSVSISSSFLTRVPRVEAGLNWNANSSTWGGLQVTAIFGAGVIGNEGFSPSPITGKTTITPVPIVAGSTQMSVGSTPSAFIGTLMDMGGASVTTSAVRGDSVTVGADTWYMCTHASGSTLLFKAV